MGPYLMTLHLGYTLRTDLSFISIKSFFYINMQYELSIARLLRVKREMSIKPREEIQVIEECDVSFETALVSSNNHLKIHLMDGLVEGKNSKECPVILLNPSLETVNVPRGTMVGNLTPVDASDFAPIEQVLLNRWV